MRRVKKGVDPTEHNMTSAPKDRRPDVLIGMLRSSCGSRASSCNGRAEARTRAREGDCQLQACMLAPGSSRHDHCLVFRREKPYLLEQEPASVAQILLALQPRLPLGIARILSVCTGCGHRKNIWYCRPLDHRHSDVAEGLTCSALVTPTARPGLGP